MLIVLVYWCISILAVVVHNCGYSVLCISIVALGIVLRTTA